MLRFHERRQVTAVLLLFPDENIERAGKQRIVHRPAILLSALQQAQAARTLSQLKLLDGWRNRAAFFFCKLQGCNGRHVQCRHTPQGKVRKPFSGFGAVVPLASCHGRGLDCILAANTATEPCVTPKYFVLQNKDLGSQSRASRQT